MKKFKKLSTLLECSCNRTPKVSWLKKYIDIIAKMGYDELYLSLTDAYKIDGEPYFNYKRGGYTVAEFNEIDAYAKSKGVDVIPNVQTLSHMAFLERHFCFTDLLDTKEILMVGEEKVYELVDKIFETMSKAFTSRRIHIGYDEAYGLGTGKYFKKHGFHDRKDLLLSHMLRVMEIGKKYGYKFEIWHDMLFESFQTTVTPEQVKAVLPEDIKIFFWNYRENNEEILKEWLFELKKNVQSFDNVGYAGAAYKINGLSTQNDFSISRIIPQMKVSSELGISQYLVTVWCDRGAWVSNWAILPTLFAAAEYAYGRYDENTPLDKKRFYEIAGIEFDDLMSLDYLNNPDKQPSKYVHNRSFRVFAEDMLVTGYDLLHKDDIGENYATLAKEYAAVNAGEYKLVFKMAEAFAKVLSVRAKLGSKIRAAYKVNDREGLEGCILKLKELQESLAAVNDVFYDFWREDNFGFGCEVNHLFIGGQVTRNDYIIRVIRDYLDNGRKIDELETETLPPSIDPEFDDDTLFVYDFPWLLTNSSIQ